MKPMDASKQTAEEQGRSSSSVGASTRLQILSTEHWSLLATRSLTYTESFSRVGMFLTVLTGAIVSLALLAQVERFNRVFIGIALLILSVVFIAGVATTIRLSTLNREDMLWVAGMNRLRRAYLEIHPDLEPYFLTASHDDLRGILATMGIEATPNALPVSWRSTSQQLLPNAAHGLSTLPAMLGLIVDVVAGVLGALVAAWFGGSDSVAITVGAATFIAMAALGGFFSQRSFMTFARSMPASFPT
jgi:hypothetical protein